MSAAFNPLPYRLRADFRPPYNIDVFTKPGGEVVVEIVSDAHVLATMSLSEKHALAVARFIVDACNEKVKP